ncbi:MAG TPA: FAD:protein FMN transferase [Steroidobacteraceae bacterium]|nr:FAD:protein FMN transferase [Steroidobacteraceae bacterium]
MRAASGPGFREVCRARPLLGTRVEIRAGGDAAEEDLHAAVDLAFAAVERVHRLMSYHDPGSELTRLNRHAGAAPQRVSAGTLAVLEAALHFARLSEGAFDPGVAATLEQWGYLPKIGAAPPAGSWRDVEVTPDGCVRFHRPVRLDLGGIAKGFAVDLAVRTLREAGVEAVVVDAGGDLRVAGIVPRRIGLRDPRAPAGSVHSVDLENAALATSAGYFSRRWDGERYVSALVDPASAQPFLAGSSVSVRAFDCMTADALTKVVLFAPPAVAERALAQCEAHAFVQASPGP